MPQVSPQAFLYFTLYIAHFEICIKNFMTSLGRQKYTQEVHFRQFQGWSKNFITLRFWNAHGIIPQSKTCFPQTKFKGINGDRIRWIWGQIWRLLKKRLYLWILCMSEETKSKSWQRPYKAQVYLILSPHSPTPSGKVSITWIFCIFSVWEIEVREKYSVCFCYPGQFCWRLNWIWNWSQ